MIALIVLLLTIFTYSPESAQGQEPEPAAEDSTKKDKKEKKGLPLEPGRTLEFTANEGSWISLDVSPDGQTGIRNQSWLG